MKQAVYLMVKGMFDDAFFGDLDWNVCFVFLRKMG
jgi:hypothetical protein